LEKKFFLGKKSFFFFFPPLNPFFGITKNFLSPEKGPAKKKKFFWKKNFFFKKKKTRNPLKVS